MGKENVLKSWTKSLLALSLFLVCGLLGAGSAQAASVTVGQTASKASSTYFYYAPGATNAHTVINNAISAAASGATTSSPGQVYIENGTKPYEMMGHILAKSNVNIVGQSRGGVILKIAKGVSIVAYGGPGTTGWGGPDSASADGGIINIWTGISNAQVKNVTLDGSCGDYYACGGDDRGKHRLVHMNIYHASNIVIDNVKFLNGQDNGSWVTNSSNIEVKNCKFQAGGHDFIEGWNNTNFKFHHNVGGMRTNSGVRCSGSTNGCYVYDNEFYTDTGGGSALELQTGATNVKIYNNYFHDISGSGGSYGAIGYPGQSPTGSGHEYYNNLFVNMPYAVRYVPSFSVSRNNIMINCSTTVGGGSDQNNIKTATGYAFSKSGTNGQGNTYWTVTSGPLASAFAGLKIGIADGVAGGSDTSSSDPNPNPDPVKYTLTVSSGSGSGSYAAGAKVTITAAAAPSGKVFDKWTGCDTCVASTTSATTTVTMPAANTTLTATYKDSTVPGKYTLTVTNGTGSGPYSSGERVSISVTVPSGQTFDHWTGDTSYLSCPVCPTPVVTMPAKNITLTAVFKGTSTVKYSLNVVNGTGDGAYASGTSVVITANSPISGRVFDKWTGDTSYVADVASEKTTVTMPAKGVTLTATYKDMTSTTGPVITASIISNTITSVVKGTTNVQLISVKLCNTGSEDLTVTSAQIAGDFSTADVKNLALYSGATTMGTPTATDTNVTFTGLNISVPKGSCVTIVIKGDIVSTTAKTSLKYCIEGCCVAVAKGTASGTAATIKTSGTLCATLTVKSSASSTATLNATLLPNAVTEANAGDKGVQLASYTITNTGTENLLITSLGFTGDFSKNIISSNTLYINDRSVGPADSATANGAFFSTLEFVIIKGETFTFTIKGDITPTVAAGTKCYAINKTATALVAKGMTSGKNATVTVNGEQSCITINGGSGLVDGAIVRAFGDIDVYILKVKNGKLFKRVVLSPSVFRSYGHLKWENVIIVDQSVLDKYTTSNLVYVVGNPTKVWLLEPAGDTGKKTLFAGSYDPDSVYEINATDFNSYVG